MNTYSEKFVRSRRSQSSSGRPTGGSSRFSKRPGGRPSSGGRNARPSFSGGRRSGATGPSRRFSGRKKSTLDIASFINKAITVTETTERFVPVHAFKDFAVDDGIKQALTDRGYELPTPIQDQVIPYILRGEDVVGLANTGTGKTAAFLIPLIHKVVQNRKEQILVLTPTRELALQIEEEFMIFAKKLRLFSVVCVGGASIGQQIHKLRVHNHIVIGTPGRVIDLIKRGNLKLGDTRSVVLDEADRMLDMGFINDIRLIMKHVPKERHTLCFSATMAPEIEKLVKDFLISPVTVSVKTQDVSKNIEQDVIRLGGRDKVDVLVEHLAQDGFGKVLVFGRTKHGVEKLSVTLRKKGIKAESIHGNKSHSQRQRALKQFKAGEIQALIATDVAARGLDISGVTHVINFDLPETYDDYVHRIGRTGRGENKGKALTFIG